MDKEQGTRNIIQLARGTYSIGFLYCTGCCIYPPLILFVGSYILVTIAPEADVSALWFIFLILAIPLYGFSIWLVRSFWAASGWDDKNNPQ
jgi:hypothetical protein